MKLTITMSNWNRAWYLERSIYLISKQTLPQDEWELIVVDDGSNVDAIKTDKIINEYKRQNIIKNFHYIKKINKRNKYGNCAIARNIGAKFGTGDYILFTDPEVMTMPDWAEQHLLANLGNSENNYIGLCLHTRYVYAINGMYRGSILDNMFTSYNWFNISETWKRIEERLSDKGMIGNLTPEEIRNEFYIYRATQAGHSLSRKMFYKVGGFEENFTNPNLGFDKWGGEDTWFHICLKRAGSSRIELEKAKAVHIHHKIVHSDYVQVDYANKYAIEHPNQFESNIGREWGLLEENGFIKIF